MLNIERFNDCIILLLLSIIYLLLSLPFYGISYTKQFIDTGRELFLPIQIVEYNWALYKNVLNIYGPLSYQLNVALLKIFGLSFDVLYISGLLTGLMVVIALYLISRIYNSKTFSFSANVILIVFLITPFGKYILPYAYAVTYATCTFYLGSYFFILFAKTEKSNYLHLAYLFYGASLSFKLDYIISIIIVSIYLILFFKHLLSFRRMITVCVLFLVVPFISYLGLINTGVSIYDMKQGILFMHSLSKSQSLKNLYILNGSFPSTFIFYKLILVFVGTFFICFILFITKNLENTKANSYEKISTHINLIVLSLLLMFFNVYTKNYLLLWLAQIFSLCALVYFLIKEHKKSYIMKPTLLYILLILLSVSSLSKSFFLLYSDVYISTSFPLCVLTFFILANQLIESKFYKNRVVLINIFTGILIISSIISYLLSLYTNNFDKVFNTPYGEIRTSTNVANNYDKVATAVNRLTDSSDIVVFVPESSILSLKTQRKSDPFLFTAFFPLFIDVLGEEYMINYLSHVNATYIVIVDRSMSEYLNITDRSSYFGQDYSIEIFDFINENYVLVESVRNDSDHSFAHIYKLK